MLATVTELVVNEETEDVIPSGFLFASVKNIGTEVLSVNGIPLAVGEAKSYPFVGKGYEEVAYEVGNEGSLRILYIM